MFDVKYMEGGHGPYPKSYYVYKQTNIPGFLEVFVTSWRRQETAQAHAIWLNFISQDNLRNHLDLFGFLP